MPENEVFGQAEGGVEVIFWKIYDTFLLYGMETRFSGEALSEAQRKDTAAVFVCLL